MMSSTVQPHQASNNNKILMRGMHYIDRDKPKGDIIIQQSQTSPKLLLANNAILSSQTPTQQTLVNKSKTGNIIMFATGSLGNGSNFQQNQSNVSSSGALIQGVERSNGQNGQIQKTVGNGFSNQRLSNIQTASNGNTSLSVGLGNGNARNFIQTHGVNFGSSVGAVLGSGAHLQTFDNTNASNAADNVNLKGILSSQSFINTTTYFSGSQSTQVNAQATNAVLTQLGNNNFSNGIKNIKHFAGYPHSDTNNNLVTTSTLNTNSENMKPTRIILIESNQDQTGTNHNNTTPLQMKSNSFHDQTQQVKGIFSNNGAAAIASGSHGGKRNTNMRQYQDGGGTNSYLVGQATTSANGSSLKTYNQIDTKASKNKQHLQLTPKAGQQKNENTNGNSVIAVGSGFSRHTFGGAGSQMSTLNNNNELLLPTDGGNDTNAPNQMRKHKNNRLVLQGQELISGMVPLSSTPNGMFNQQLRNYQQMKNFGDINNNNNSTSDEKQFRAGMASRVTESNLNEVVGTKAGMRNVKKASIDVMLTGSMIENHNSHNHHHQQHHRMVYNQGNQSPTIILKTTILEQTSLDPQQYQGNQYSSQQQTRIRGFNYKSQTTYDAKQNRHVDDELGMRGSTVLQSDETFRKLGGPMLARPGIRMSLTKESSRLAQNSAYVKQERTNSNHPPPLIGAIIEGSSIVSKHNRRQNSNEKQNKVSATMNRKHLIHQRIKCQGIPVVHNATQYNNQGGQLGQGNQAIVKDFNSSTHFSNFRQTQYDSSVSQGIRSGESSTSQIKGLSTIDAQIFSSIAATKEFQELAQTLSMLPQFAKLASQTSQEGGGSPQSIFDHEETMKMIKNYSSLIMKDSKFRDNMMLAVNQQQNNNQLGGASPTPYIQYLIKNFKTRGLDYSGSKFAKYYHHNYSTSNPTEEEEEGLANGNNPLNREAMDMIEKSGNKSRLMNISNQNRSLGGTRSQTSIKREINSDHKRNRATDDKKGSNDAQPFDEELFINNANSQQAQSIRLQRYQNHKNSQGDLNNNMSSQEDLNNGSPYKDGDSQRILNREYQKNFGQPNGNVQPTLHKNSSKLIQSLKRYASKERFQKLLDQIANTAMKESVDLDGSEEFQQRLWEASQWLIQEQLRQRNWIGGTEKTIKNFSLKGTNVLSGSRQVSTPTYGDKRGAADYRIKENQYMLPMKIQQIQKFTAQTIQSIVDESQDDEKKAQAGGLKGQGSKLVTPLVKRFNQKAPLIPSKPKMRLDLLLQPMTKNIQMQEVNELFSQINRFIFMTIKHKEAYTNLQLQEIKYQSISLGLKLTNQDLQLGFLKSNNFIVMLRSKVSALVNKFIIPSFPGQHGIVSLAKTLFPHQVSSTAVIPNNGGGNNQSQKSTFKFWVENSGNNHQLVKQIFKKRSWLILSTDYVPPAYGPSNQTVTKLDSKYDNQASAQSQEEVENTEDIKQVTTAGGPHLIWTQLRRPKILRELTIDQLYNHLDGINTIATKTGMFLILKSYYEEKKLNVFDVVPETYIINIDNGKLGSSGYDQRNQKDRQIEEFTKAAGNHIWILKPGENTNRGHGIQIFDDVRKIIHSINHEYTGSYKSVILQKYIPNPYLISRRKFDFRVYGLLTYNYLPQPGSNQPLKQLRGYFYDEGYLRTSCKEFNLKQIHNKFMHLTNDAVQKYSQDYGKFENGNKISYEDFRTILLKDKNIDFQEIILPQIKQRIKEVYEASGPKLVGEIRWDYNGFELMGFDFMLDDDLKLYLIECNTNPCLETQQSILLQRIIPQVLDQSFKLAVDPFLRASEQQYANAPEISLTEIRYEMIYEHKFTPKAASSITADSAAGNPTEISSVGPRNLHLNENKKVEVQEGNEEDEDEELLMQQSLPQSLSELKNIPNSLQQTQK